MNMHNKERATQSTPANSAVWFEIPVSDLEKAKAFYSKVLMTDFTDVTDGPNPFAIFAYKGGDACVSGHLYPGTPAASGTGATIHLAVADTVEAAMERVGAAGGKVVSPVIQIPDGRFAYCLDPDGNSIGLFTR